MFMLKNTLMNIFAILAVLLKEIGQEVLARLKCSTGT